MSDDKTQWTIALIVKLLNAGIGDPSRLTAIQYALENKRPVYESDKQYLKEKYQILMKQQSDTRYTRDPVAASEGMAYNNEVSTLKMIEPRISSSNIVQYAKETAAKNSKGGFLGKGKILENAFSWELFFYPYYDVEIEETTQTEEKRGWFSKETVTQTLKIRLSFDGMTGAVVNTSEDGISYTYAFLNSLDMDEIRLLYYTSRINRFSIVDLRGLQYSDTKVRRLADGLAANGLLTKSNTRPAIYRQIHPYPVNPSAFTSIRDKHEVVESSSRDRSITPVINAYSFQSLVNKYWVNCSVTSSELLHYPYYGIAYQRGNIMRTEIIDATSGTRQQYLDRIVSVQPRNRIS